ncbi:MAG: SDR family oxidoreductase [Acidobacteria bacterium]|nr:SDR family oxidoreductase [Acidobacteriota bacterium]
MILVVGSTGSVGGRIVRGLLGRGESVRALARPSSNHAPLSQAGAAVVFGDLTDPASLAGACRGVDTVITTATVSKTGTDTIEHVDLEGTARLIDAAREAGARHFIFVSTVGASPDAPHPLFRAKGIAEQRLRESGLAFTILQPSVFMDVWFPMLIEMPAFSGRPVTLVGQSMRRHAFIAEQDVAAFAVAAVFEPAARHATLVIGGPEAVTFRDVVRAYEEASGRAIEVRSVAPGEPIPGVPDAVSGLAAALESFDTVIPMQDLARRYGVTQTSVLDFARARVSAGRAGAR